MKLISFIVNVGIKLPVKCIDITIQEMAVFIININFISSQFSSTKLLNVHTEVKISSKCLKVLLV